MRLSRLYLGLAALLLGVSLAIGNAQPTGENGPAAADDDRERAERTVYVLPIHGMISDITLMSMERRVAEAEEAGADLIVFEIDTYGGLVTSALEIGTFIKGIRTETLVWVNDKAISAGAMISVAADGIVMAERSRIGDSAPIAIGGGLEGRELAKVETLILEEFRDSARRNGYPQTLSEAMVTLGPAIYQIKNDETGEVRYVYATELPTYGLESHRTEYTPPPPSPRERQPRDDQPGSPFGMSLAAGVTPLVANAAADEAAAEPPADDAEQTEAEAEQVPQAERDEADTGEGPWRKVQLVNPANTLVTLSQDEAVEHGFARAIVADDAALMAFTDATAETFHRIEMSWSEMLAGVLVSPGVRAVLMILLLVGAYMELQSPGVGLPGAVAVIALLLMLAPPFVAGMADMTEVLLIAFGLILIGVELFLLPGFGLAGILGVLLVLAGFVMTFVPKEPEPGWLPTLEATWEGLRQGLLAIITAVIVTGIAGFFLARHIDRVPFFRRMILEDSVDMRPLQPAGAGGAGVVPVEEISDVSAASREAGRAGAAPPMPSGVQEGAAGEALTGLRPAGRAQIDGEVVDVVTSGRWIEAGEPVRIVEVRGNRVVVEQA